MPSPERKKVKPSLQASLTTEVDTKVSKIQTFTHTICSDREEHLLYVCRVPVMDTVHRRNRIHASIVGTLTDGTVQINCIYPTFDENTAVPPLVAGSFIKCKLLILRRLNEDLHTIDLRVTVMQHQLIESTVQVDVAVLLQLPMWEFNQTSNSPALDQEHPSSNSIEVDDDVLQCVCDGIECSAAFNRSSGHEHSNGDDYSCYSGDGLVVESKEALNGTIEPLRTYQCVLHTFSFGSLHEMRAMNQYATAEIFDMTPSQKRHLMYYFIAIMGFRARERLTLPTCVVKYIRSVYPKVVPLSRSDAEDFAILKEMTF